MEKKKLFIWAFFMLFCVFFVSVSCSSDNEMLKTDDIHPPKSVISVHFFCLTCLMALQI